MLGNGIDRGAFERSLIERLVDTGKLDQPAADRALRLRAASAERLEALLIKLGLASERDVAEALARELGLPLAAPPDYPETASPRGQGQPEIPAPGRRAAARRDRRGHRRRHGRSARRLRRPRAGDGERHGRCCGRSRCPRSSRPPMRGSTRPSSSAAGQGRPTPWSSGSDEDLLEDVDRLRDLASEAPVIRLVNQLIARAVEQPRLRHPHRAVREPARRPLPHRRRAARRRRRRRRGSRAAIISRIKIMAKLNIAERRLPQDGRIRLRDPGQGIRPARLHRADAARRERRDAHPRPRQPGRTISTRSGFASETLDAVPRRARSAARHPPGHRPDRQRQDHDALHRCCGSTRRRRRSSPSRTRSNTSSTASTRSRSSRRSA